MDYLTTHASLSPIQRMFAPGFVNCKKGCIRLAAASEKVYQLLAHGRWFSPGTPASSTTKTGRHDIAEILLKVTLNTKKPNHICLGWLVGLTSTSRYILIIALSSIQCLQKIMQRYHMSILAYAIHFRFKGHKWFL